MKVTSTKSGAATLLGWPSWQARRCLPRSACACSHADRFRSKRPAVSAIEAGTCTINMSYSRKTSPSQEEKRSVEGEIFSAQERDRERVFERDRERGAERDPQRDRERVAERSRQREPQRDRQRERQKDRQKEGQNEPQKEAERDREKDRERDREKDEQKGSERDREKDGQKVGQGQGGSNPPLKRPVCKPLI